jgi:hypothetical protein
MVALCIQSQHTHTQYLVFLQGEGEAVLMVVVWVPGGKKQSMINQLMIFKAACKKQWHTITHALGCVRLRQYCCDYKELHNQQGEAPSTLHTSSSLSKWFKFHVWVLVLCTETRSSPLSHNKKSIAPSHKLQHSNSVPGKGGDSSVMASVSDVEIMFWSERSYLISWTEWTTHTSNHTEIMW